MTVSRNLAFADRWWRRPDGSWGVAPPHSEEDEARANEVLAHYSRLIDSDATPPTTLDMIRWWNSGECPTSALEEVERRLTQVLGEVDHAYEEMLELLELRVLAFFGAGIHGQFIPRLQDVGAPGMGFGFHFDISSLAAQHSGGTGFCLSPLIYEWLNSQPKVVGPNRRSTAIIPSPAKVRDLVQMTELPVASGLTSLGPMTEGMALLPTFEHNRANPLLLLYDASGIAPSYGDNEVPAPFRLWMLGVMAASIGPYHQFHRVRLTLRDMSEWLWPRGWHRGRDIPKLRQALQRLVYLYMPWERALWLSVRPVALPGEETRLDDLLYLDVQLPPGSEQGPMISRAHLSGYGAESAKKFRGYLAASYYLDTYGTRKGRIIQATRPEVLRDEQGQILGADGKPLRDRRGRLVDRYTDPRAVRTGKRERNPMVDRYPVLGAKDILRLVSPLGVDDRKNRKRARETLEALATDGVILLEEGRTRSGEGGLRILPPPAWGPDWRPDSLPSQPRPPA